LQNRFVPFQLAITFHKTFGLNLEATLSRFLITHIQFKGVINQKKIGSLESFLIQQDSTNKVQFVLRYTKDVVQAPKA